jgi:hypothetical protein
MAMLMDIIDCLLDRATVNTLILMTGDSDFIRVVARARNRFSKRVIIAGVPGSVSNDLIASADAADPLIESDWVPVTIPPEPPAPFEMSFAAETASPNFSIIEQQMIRLLDRLVKTKPYLTFLFVKTHAMSPTSQLNLTPLQVDTAMTRFKELGILRDEIKEQEGRTLRLLYFTREHPLVQQVLATPN